MDEILFSISNILKKTLEEIYCEFESKVPDSNSREALRKIVDRYMLMPSLDEIKDAEPIENCCPHIMASGKRKGHICGKKVSPTGRLCKTHTPKFCIFLTKDGKCKRDISRFSTSGKMCKIHLIDELGDKAKLIRKSKYGYFVNRETGLVFEDGKVVGREGEDGKVHNELENEDLECIRTYKFRVGDLLLPIMKAYVAGEPIPVISNEAEIILVDD